MQQTNRKSATAKASGSAAGTRSTDSAGFLMRKVGKALKTPGISRDAVFKSPTAFAYSVYPKDPTKVVRIAADGTRTIGRLHGTKFKEAA